jgi:hypothetical protein
VPTFPREGNEVVERRRLGLVAVETTAVLTVQEAAKVPLGDVPHVGVALAGISPRRIPLSLTSGSFGIGEAPLTGFLPCLRSVGVPILDPELLLPFGVTGTLPLTTRLPPAPGVECLPPLVVRGVLPLPRRGRWA